MKNSTLLPFILIPLLLLTGCSKDSDPEPKCLIERIRVNDNSFLFTYSSGDQLHEIHSENYNSSTNQFERWATHQLQQTGSDSVTVSFVNPSNGSLTEPPEVTALYEDNRIKEAKQYFLSGGVITYEFAYDESQIVVNMYYNNPDISRQHTHYGLYELDASGNVSFTEQYQIESNGDSTLFIRKSYTYDNSNNPWQSLIYPLLTYGSLPNSRFFSPNNILTESTATVANTYGYADGLTINGEVNGWLSGTGFGIVEEYYSYKNCYRWEWDQ